MQWRLFFTMSSYIYHGPWINWSHGPILGATLTLGERNGGLLTAFIATFVTVVGPALWKIIAYIIHQIRSGGQQTGDGLYHQTQVLLRNESTPTGAAWKFLQQSWYWRSKVSRPVLRTIPLYLFALFYVVLFGVLAIFSSEISKAPGAARLIISDNCGYWRTNNSDPQSLYASAYKDVRDR